MSCLLLVLNHGIVSVGLFLCASIYIDYEGTRNTLKWRYSHDYINGLMLCLILSNMGFPFTIGFFGELLGCLSFISTSFIFLLFFLFSQLIVTVYNLRLFWLVSVNDGPYLRISFFDNYLVLVVIYIILFFNFFLFILFSIYV